MLDCADPAIRNLTYVQAIQEATDQAMESDPNVIVIGQDIADHKGIQGTTLGLSEKYGPNRIIGTPLSEDAVMGSAIGAAMNGLRPIFVTIRMDFLLLAVNQLINIAAKVHYMYGSQYRVPLVVRCIVGRSWGQGAQHSQALHSLFMHIPGLKLVAPSNAKDAKGCLLAAIKDDNPVIVMEHRLLYGTSCEVPEEHYETRQQCQIRRRGNDITIVAISSMVPQALKAAELLAEKGVDAQVVDPVWLSPLDIGTITHLVKHTGALLVVDNAWLHCGASAEIIASVSEQLNGRANRTVFGRMGFAFTPCPTTPSLEDHFYPSPQAIAAKAWSMIRPTHAPWAFQEAVKLDHEASFQGPF